MTLHPDQIETDVDRWGYRAGSRFVGPKEWLDAVPHSLRLLMHLDTITLGLATAADDEGKLINFRMNECYTDALSDVLRSDHEEESWRLKYDTFCAMVLQDATFRLIEAGLLATRGNGDSVDYRLCLPEAA